LTECCLSTSESGVRQVILFHMPEAVVKTRSASGVTCSACVAARATSQHRHSLNPVPLIVAVPGAELAGGGILADVAPTILAMLGIDQPASARSPVARVAARLLPRLELFVRPRT